MTNPMFLTLKSDSHYEIQSISENPFIHDVSYHPSPNGKWRFLGFLHLCLLAVVLTTFPVFGQTADVTQRVLPVAEMSDLDFLNDFLEEHFIAPQDPDFTSGIFFDITRDGFGSNDVLVLYPSEEQFHLSAYLPDNMSQVLRTQGLATDYNLVTTRNLTEVIVDEAENETNPKKALAGAMLGSIQNYYTEGEFQGYISQQGDNLRVSFWGYGEDDWFFTPKSEICMEPPKNESVVVVAHKQPEIRTFLDVDGCVVVESSTAGGDVSSRVCD